MNPTRNQAPEPLLQEALLTKDELNLIEFPFALPCYRHPKDRDVIEIEIEGKDPDGRLITRKWTVRAAAGLGLPLAGDEEVLLALFHLWQKDRFKDNHVFFTQYSLLRLLHRRSDSQREYKRLEESLDRLSGVGIKSVQSFWSQSKKGHVTDKFGIISNYRLWHRERPDGEDTKLSRVTFDDVFLDSVQSGYIRTLDFDFYLSLRYPLAQKLFRFLDKRAYRHPIVEMRLKDLAARLAMTGNEYPSLIKADLDAPHQELIDRRFLAGVRYETRSRTPWVRYDVVPKANRKTTSPPTQQIAPPATDPPLVKDLIARGLTKTAAEALVEQFSERRIMDQVEAFDYRVKRGSREITKNPAGFLRKAIEDDFPLPKGFTSKAEQERKRHERETAARRDAEAKAASERAERERQDRFQRLWDSLIEAKQVEILAEATTRLDPFARQQLARENAAGPCHGTLRHHRDEILAQRFPDHPGRMGTEVLQTRRSKR